MKGSVLGGLLLLSVTILGQEKSLSWKISGNGLMEPSYLYGTMHTQDKRVFEFKEGVMQAFKTVDVYVMEVVVDLADQFKLMGLMMMKGDTTLKDLLTKGQYDSVSNYFKDSLGQSLVMMQGMLPMLTAQLIELKDLGSEQELALDLYFSKLAEEQGKEVKGLETAEEQIKALNALSYEDQANALYEAVRGKYEGEVDHTLDQLLAAYLQGDLEKMLDLMKEDPLGDEEAQAIFEEHLLLKRNRVMVGRLIPMITDQSAFIAVGAAHLGGKQGIIAMLRQLGYTVEVL